MCNYQNRSLKWSLGHRNKSLKWSSNRSSKGCRRCFFFVPRAIFHCGRRWFLLPQAPFFPERFRKSARIRVLMVASCRADLKEQPSLFIMQIRCLWCEQWPFKVSKRTSRRMRDIICEVHPTNVPGTPLRHVGPPLTNLLIPNKRDVAILFLYNFDQFYTVFPTTFM